MARSYIRSVLAPSSDALCYYVASLLLVVRPGATSVASLLLVAMPFAPSSILAPSSEARSYPSSVLAPSSNALCS